MKNRHILKKVQETLCIEQWRLSSLQSRHLGNSRSSPNHYQLPVLFSWISSKVWSLFPFKGDFSFEKSQKSQGTKSRLYRSWVTWVIWCFAKNLYVRHDAWAGTLSWWSCQSPVVHRCGLLNHLNSFHGGMFKLNAKCGADLLLYSLMLNIMATQYTYSPHLLLPLTSTVKSSLFMHVHSSPLSLAAR